SVLVSAHFRHSFPTRRSSDLRGGLLPLRHPQQQARAMIPRIASLRFLLVVVLAGAGAASPAIGRDAVPTPGHTLIGTPLRDPDWPESTRAYLEKDVEIARAVLAIAPEREDSWIWLGRRLAYLNRFDEAIDVFTRGLERFPD